MLTFKGVKINKYSKILGQLEDTASIFGDAILGLIFDYLVDVCFNEFPQPLEKASNYGRPPWLHLDLAGICSF